MENYINPLNFRKLMKFTSGSTVLDKFLEGGYEEGITTIYGPSGSGKTLFGLIAALETAKNKKVIYIDTTNSFSAERIKQLNKNKSILENILLLKPKNFYKQKIAIEGLKENINKDIGLIILSTISHLYRLEIAKKDVIMINKVLASQLNCLNNIAEKNNIPVIVITGIYDDLEKKDSVKMLGGEILKMRSNCIIELKKYKTMRKALMIKPSKKEFLFKIEEKGISEVILR